MADGGAALKKTIAQDNAKLDRLRAKLGEARKELCTKPGAYLILCMKNNDKMKDIINVFALFV